jgi:hypothetical protein
VSILDDVKEARLLLDIDKLFETLDVCDFVFALDDVKETSTLFETLDD